MLKTLGCSAALLAAACFAPIAFSQGAAAASTVDLDTSAGSIVSVFDGCGPYSHRGPYGGCRPGGQFGGYGRGRPCPPGFHLGPYGRLCRPNRY